tara:strand:- start:905 stop:1756 length:852 start_codon:yes stop_codon:yes gene_type:complete
MKVESLKKKYDLSVVYRIYPGVSKIPIVHKNDKYELSKIAINSFKDSLGDMSVKIWVLLDDCPSKFEDLFDALIENYDVELIRFDGIGNYATFNKQIEILLNQNFSENVYFAEDDYIFVKNGLKEAVNFINLNQKVDFLTIYDSLDYYNMDLHNYKSNFCDHNAYKWRTVSSTTLSFMTTKDILKETKWIFETYSFNNNFDSSLWMSLTKLNLFQLSSVTRYLFKKDRDLIRIAKSWLYCWRQIIFGKKYNLWSPVPSLGTHLDEDGISPGINWDEVIEESMR